MSYRKKKLGILGGGQLGRMMYEAIIRWDLDIHFMDKSKDFPVGKICPQFFEGDFANYEDVMKFGSDKDVLTIEIESVNVQALKDLEKQGKTVHPSPDALKIINDKGLQKMFYESYNIPTSSFTLYETIEDIKSDVEQGKLSIPFVQKSRKGGYDGRGVHIVRNEADLDQLLQVPSLVEGLVSVHKEIAVIAARNEEGELMTYDPVEMVFDPKANLVDYLFAPAEINPKVAQKASDLAKEIITKLDICGLLAVEFFIDDSGRLLVNEAAPRAHNSGHHTIEACVTSQFEQHIRGVLNMPLGNPELLRPAVMVNILGENEAIGPVVYNGMKESLHTSNVHLHFYGKSTTKPKRKMGHFTVIDESLEIAKEKAQLIKKTLKATI